MSYILFRRLSCNFLLSFCIYIFIYLIEFIQIRLDKWPLRLQLILTRFLMGKACDHQRKGNWINITKFPIPFHAQEKLLVLIIVVEMTSNFRQEIRYSYYRNDPVKYDLNCYLLEGKLLPAILGTLLLRKILITGELVINCNMIMSTRPTLMNAIIRVL